MHPQSTTEALAADTRAKKHAMERAKAEHAHGLITYEELARVAQAFCAAFDTYHRARFGKPKRLDYRAVLR
jgi:hypothetical protein